MTNTEKNDLLNRLKIISQGLGNMGQFASAAEVDKAATRIEELEQEIIALKAELEML